jgi:dihydropteroate synthase
MVGASRKRFIGEVTGIEVPAERVFGTAAACAMAVAGGALALRVHDVAEMRQAVAVAAAVAEVDET